MRLRELMSTRLLRRAPGLPWPAAVAVNLALRGIIYGVVLHALLDPDAPQYVDKAIGSRGLVLIPASLVLPLIHWAWRRGGRYPIWTDNLYLSIFALDMGGNLLDLYDRFFFFDLVTHTHGTGVLTVVVSELVRGPVTAGLAVAQVVLILLEAQEYYSDVLFGLRNVRGPWDTLNDLLAGVAGSLAYGAAYAALRRVGWINRRS